MCICLSAGERVSTNSGKTFLLAGRTVFVCSAAFLVLLSCCPQAYAETPEANQSSQPQQASTSKPAPESSTPPQNDLTQVSIENLMNVEVTSASKKEQKLSQVAAAIFVITREDIRDSGVLSIPDLLRMVPGLDVAQISSNAWAISARGFNLQFANKTLVLIDGRAVYTPLFGGVNWDTQDMPLEDIERIEVIRGPGGTVWGSNAVDGVINIITKKAKDTQGMLVTAGGGTQAEEFGTLQYGGKIKNESSYRIFAKYQNNNQSPDLDGGIGGDGWHLLHAGFRLDTKLSAKDSLTTQGDVYTGEEGAEIVHSVFTPPENINVERLVALSGGNILARWEHTFSSRSDATIQFYFDRYGRGGPESDEVLDTFDFDFQNHIMIGARQDLIWGIGYRHTSDLDIGTVDQTFVPPKFSAGLFSTFVQDQITLKPDRVALYIGSKLENNYFTGFDLQPSVRLAWTPSTRRTFWAAVSRAVRTPTRRDVGLNAALAALPGPAEVVLLGNPNMNSEHVITYEVGYRAQPADRISIAMTMFINNYHGLESIEPLPSFFDPNSVPPLLVHPQSLGNQMYGTTEGLEAYLNWKVNRRWTLSPGYSFLEMHLRLQALSQDSFSVTDTQGSNPGHQAQLRSHVELSSSLAWDTNAYFVGPLPAQFVPSYTRLDSQLTWRLREHLQLSVTGQNLLKDHHTEFNDQLQINNSTQVKRSAYTKITWQF
jgi:iron complex outermembrane receptor protein